MGGRTGAWRHLTFAAVIAAGLALAGTMVVPVLPARAAAAAEELTLGREQVRELQRRLKAEGFDPGPVDGILGPGTRAAIRAFRKANGLPEGEAVDPAVVAVLWADTVRNERLARLLRRAEEALAGGDLDAALAALDRAAGAAPDDPEVWTRRGVLLRRLGRPHEAIASFDRALAFDPSAAVARNGRQLAEAELARAEKARRAAAAAAKPHTSPRSGRPIAATGAAERSRRLDARTWRAVASEPVASSDPERELADIDRRLEASPGPGLAQAWIRRGVLLRQLGRPREALESFERALAQDPGNLTARLGRQLARAALREAGGEEYRNARQERAGAAGPEATDPLASAQAARARGDLRGALGIVEEALAEAPDDLGLLAARADLLESLDRLDEALAVWDRILELAPGRADFRDRRDALARLLGREHTAGERRGQQRSEAGGAGPTGQASAPATDVRPETRTPAEELAAAGEAKERGDLDAALRHYDRALELDSKLALAWNNRGVVLGRLGRHEEALASLDRALELDPKDAEAWTNRGNVLDDLGRFEEALASLDRALELDPENATAWYNRGDVLRHLGRHEEALSSYDRALELDPKDAAAWTNRGVVLDRLGRFEEALESYDAALELRPRNPVILSNRGSVLRRMGRYPASLDSYDQALRADPNDAIAWMGRGNTLFALGRYQDALADYEKSIKLDQNLAMAWTDHGAVLDHLGRYDDALKDHERALQIDPQLALAWFNRGIALYHLGRYAEARENIEKAATLGLDQARWALIELLAKGQ